MMRFAIASMAAFVAVASSAQLGEGLGTGLGAERSVVAESVSGVVTNFSWQKNVITETEDGQLRDKNRVLASIADAAAEEETAKNIGRVAKAWQQGFSNGVESLRASLSNVPKTGRFVTLQFPVVPLTSRRFDIYVASNSYDSASNEDVLYIYFGQSFTNSPTMTVPYVWESGFTTNRVAGSWTKKNTTDHFTNTYDIVLHRTSSADVHYTCHKLYVKRPEALRNIPCNLNPHGKWGGPDGVAFGSYLLTVTDGGATYPTFTGPVTNSETGVVALFDNGAFLGLVPIEN